MRKWFKMNAMNIEDEIKELIVKSLRLEEVKPQDIESDAPLFGKGLGLDSIDALELSVALAKKYGVLLDGKTIQYKKHFASVRNLAAFVSTAQKGKRAVKP
jgi:acyl carrier protein